MDQIVMVVASVLVSNVIQSWLTVQGVKVHIDWLRESVQSAHKRIDSLQRPKVHD